MLVLGPGESVRFRNVDLPARARLELDLAVDPECPVPVRRLELRLALHGADGSVERRQVPVAWELADGQEWLDLSLELEAPGPIPTLRFWLPPPVPAPSPSMISRTVRAAVSVSGRLISAVR